MASYVHLINDFSTKEARINLELAKCRRHLAIKIHGYIKIDHMH